MLLRSDLGVDNLRPPRDLADGDDMDGDAKDEMVVVLWKALLVEEDVDKEPDQAEDDVEGDGVVAEDGTDQADGAELEDTVEEEEGEVLEGFEQLLLDGQGDSPLVEKERLDPWHGEHQHRAGEGKILDH